MSARRRRTTLDEMVEITSRLRAQLEQLAELDDGTDAPSTLEALFGATRGPAILGGAVRRLAFDYAGQVWDAGTRDPGDPVSSGGYTLDGDPDDPVSDGTFSHAGTPFVVVDETGQRVLELAEDSVGFLGAGPVPRQRVRAPAETAAEAITLANDTRAALIALGLVR